MLSYEYIQFLNEKIIQYLPHPYVQIGDKLNFRCPICGDSRKSSTKKRGWWYLQNSSFFCFNCGTSMSGINFLKVLSGSDYEAIHKEYVDLFLKSGQSSSLSSIAWKPNVDDEPSILQLKRAFDPSIKHPLSSRAKEYLNSRKVLDAPFLKEQLFSTYLGESKEEYILIPWRLNGIDAYYQVNDFLKLHSIKYRFPKGKKKLLYGLDNVDPSYKKIFVFEGVYDSLFVKNGIASGTKSLTDYQMKLIHERWPHHEVCISFDNDAPGFSAMMQMIEKDKACKFFMWFDENTQEKDINERVLTLNDTSIFSKEDVVDKMVYDKLQMKLWMMQHGKWKAEQKPRIDYDLKKKAFLPNKMM